MQHLLSESPHAYVFCATHSTSQEQAVFKIARSFKAPVKRPRTAQPGYFRIHPSGFEPYDPSCNEVISNQIEQLTLAHDWSLVAITGSGIIEGKQYYRMPLIAGQSLRQFIDLGKVPVDVVSTFAELAAGLARLEKQGFHHGNLAAEHVIIREGGGTLLSPGSFPHGLLDPKAQTQVPHLQAQSSQQKSVPIFTTPSYYPLLDCNDILALCIVLWEAFTLHHPFEANEGKEQKLSPYIVHTIKEQEARGNTALSPLKTLRLPREQAPHLSPALEAKLLRAVGLRLDADGVLDFGNSRRDPSAIVDMLQNLSAD
jgi:hypothetical protein